MLRHRSKIQKYAWDGSFSRRRGTTSNKKLILIVPILLLLIAFSVSFTKIVETSFSKITNVSFSKIKEITSPIGSLIGEKKSNGSTIKSTIEEVIKDEKGDYSFFVKNLRTGEEEGVEVHKVYDTASLYKLWVAAVVEERIRRGELGRDEELKEDVVQLNERFNIATEDAELKEGEINITVIDALTKMIVVSDNYSALVLSKRVGLSNVEDFLKDYGFSESTIDPPQSTAYDIGQFYQLLYNSRIINAGTSSDIMALLKSQRLNDRIPKYLPDNVIIAHKTGELGRIKHDGGIVFAPFGDYIFVAMSKTSNPQNAAEVIARVSSRIYKYFEKQAVSKKKS